jgi:hypothetical protein
MLTNSKVTTPIGKGIVQGSFAVMSGTETVTRGVMVRLPINEQTRGEMKKSNCLTPQAEISGLWVFSEDEVMG